MSLITCLFWTSVANGNVDLHDVMEGMKAITGEHKVTINLNSHWNTNYILPLTLNAMLILLLYSLL